MLCLLVRIDLKYLTDAIVVIPLLKKFFFVRHGIALYEILKLREIRGEEDTTTHGWADEGGQNIIAFQKKWLT